MKRSEFSAKTAAATEACASTGVGLMLPIMGAVTAFVFGMAMTVTLRHVFFVLDPALVVGQGTDTQVLLALVAALTGIWLMASGFRGYIIGFGPLSQDPMTTLGRGLLLIGGSLMVIPGMGTLGLTNSQTAKIGAVLAVCPIMLARKDRPVIAT